MLANVGGQTMTRVERKKEYSIRAWIVQQEKQQTEVKRAESEQNHMNDKQGDSVFDEKERS